MDVVRSLVYAWCLPSNTVRAENRLTPGEVSVFRFVLGTVPQIIQLASALRNVSFPATAVQNDVVDGHAVFVVSLALAGNSLRQDLPVAIGTPNATIKVLDDESEY